jgi:hypothetical protein
MIWSTIMVSSMRLRSPGPLDIPRNRLERILLIGRVELAFPPICWRRRQRLGENAESGGDPEEDSFPLDPRGLEKVGSTCSWVTLCKG